MPEARQLCKASHTFAADDRPCTSCPHCGTKINPTLFERFKSQGRIEMRPIIPAHIRDEQGEVRAKVRADQHRYPGT